MKHLTSNKFLERIKTKGTAEEKQLAHRWQNEIDLFFRTFSDNIFKRHARIRAGTERAPSLKLILIPSSEELCRPSLKRFLGTLDNPIGDYPDAITSCCTRWHLVVTFFENRRRIQLIAFGCSGQPEQLLRFPERPVGVIPRAYSMDDSGQTSIFLDGQENPGTLSRANLAAERLSEQLRLPVAPRVNTVLEEITPVPNSPGNWKSAGILLELSPVDYELILRIRSRYPGLSFSYFILSQKNRSLVFRMSPQKGFSGIWGAN